MRRRSASRLAFSASPPSAIWGNSFQTRRDAARLRRRLIRSLPALLLLTACGGTGEAADPSEILGDDLHYRGADGTAPNQGAPPKEEPSMQPASEAECKRAAEHLVALGYDLEVARIADPVKRQLGHERRAEVLGSEEARLHVRELTQELLQQGRTKAEIECFVRAKSEEALERCESAL